LYKNHKIGLVIIAYNEEKLIGKTLEGVPEYIDNVIVVDDCSTDNTKKIVKEKAKMDNRIHLLHHEKNKGPGGAIITGYLASSEMGNEVTVVIGGDDQMDQSEMYKFIDPIIEHVADYTKGNRFMLDAFGVMPFKRVIGNIALSILTDLVAWDFSIFDTQDGYTAISKQVIDTIDWTEAHKGYGYVSDFIIRISTHGFKIKDIPRKSIYLPNIRQSQIEIEKYIIRFFSLLFKALKWKIHFKFSNKKLLKEC